MAGKSKNIQHLSWSYSARYLGVMIGPCAEEVAWEEAIAKYRHRAELWRKLGLGTHYDVRMYSVFVVSVLQFVNQFYTPPKVVFEEEEKTLKLLLRGPAHSCRTTDILHLKDWYNFSNQPHSLKNINLASKARAAATETWLLLNEGRLSELERLDKVDGPLPGKLLKWVKGGMFTAIRTAVAEVKEVAHVPRH